MDNEQPRQEPAAGYVNLVTSAKRAQARQMRKRPTPAEAALWHSLQANRCGGAQFRRQQVLHGSIVDFYCRDARLVIEVDGSIHDQQTGHDENRSRILAEYGYFILRFDNNAVLFQRRGVLDRIAQALASRRRIL